MNRYPGYYALLQFSPIPERLEFLNFGVLLIVPELNYFGVRVAQTHGRIDRFFDRNSKLYLQDLKSGIGDRLRFEYEKTRSIKSIEEYAKRRANDIRVSEILSIAVSEPQKDLENLFLDLVGEDKMRHREPRMARKLRDAFSRENIFGLVDENPPPVEIPEAGIQINAPFGYQNGAYNLIDGVRLGESANDAMKETGRKALEGGLLWKHFANENIKKRLIVVADFKNHSNEFYHAVGDMLSDNHVKLYRLDNIRPLIEDITHNASAHA